ncbi:MAG: RsmD family RNA methyltransferase [Bacteroidales bacterium]
MRIVGGTYGGRRIAVSKGFDSRPTTDFAKEALFNILDNHFNMEDLRVLDLFSGTGSISFEFASRGCTEIDLVDINSRSVQFIAKVAAELGMKGIHPVRMDVFPFINICRKQYHVIFADPPYELKSIQDIPGIVFSHQLLEPGGWFILEHGKSNSFKNDPHFFQERNYGSVHFSFFKLNM